jgi:hypothetical protein
MRTILTIIVLTLAVSAFKCSSPAGPSFTGALSDHIIRKTQKGASVHSAKAISDAQLSGVDQGLDKLFRIASNPPYNYKGFNLHPAYTVWLLSRDARCVNPGFTEIVYSDPAPNGYDETYTDSPANHWDKDPRTGSTLLCVAGFMARTGATADGVGSPGMGVVDDVEQLPTITRFEGEHNLLLEVDLDKFTATQYHYGANGGHPILQDSDGSLVAEQSPIEMKGFTVKLPKDVLSKEGKLLFKQGDSISGVLVK